MWRVASSPRKTPVSQTPSLELSCDGMPAMLLQYKKRYSSSKCSPVFILPACSQPSLHALEKSCAHIWIIFGRPFSRRVHGIFDYKFYLSSPFLSPRAVPTSDLFFGRYFSRKVHGILDLKVLFFIHLSKPRFTGVRALHASGLFFGRSFSRRLHGILDYKFYLSSRFLSLRSSRLRCLFGISFILIYHRL